MQDQDLHGRISSIKQTLQRLSNSLIEEVGDVQKVEAFTPTQLSTAYQFNLEQPLKKSFMNRRESRDVVELSSPITYGGYAHSIVIEPPIDADSVDLLTYERQRTKELEAKVKQKDAILGDMTKLQEELYKTVEQLQGKLRDLQVHNQALQSENDYLVEKLQKTQDGVAHMRRGSLNERGEGKSAKYQSDLQNLTDQLTTALQKNELLTREKSSLQQELEYAKSQNCPTFRESQTVGIDELRLKIQQLEAENSALKNTQQKKTPLRDISNQQPKSLSMTVIQDKKQVSHKQVCRRLSKLLGVKSSSQLYDKILVLYKTSDSYVKYGQFLENLKNLIWDFSPPEHMEYPPKPKYMWKWITKLVEDYMRYKK